MGLLEDLGEGPVGLDTAVLIYWMEEHTKYLPIIYPVFEAIQEGQIQVVTSAVTLLETLVKPFREGDIALAELYENQLLHTQNLDLVPLDLPLLRAAAHVRELTGAKTPVAVGKALGTSATMVAGPAPCS